MKIANSLKTLKKRDKNCRVVRRKGRVYVINKTNPRYKARQGWARAAFRMRRETAPVGAVFCWRDP